jgi:hypothetical protein
MRETPLPFSGRSTGLFSALGLVVRGVLGLTIAIYSLGQVKKYWAIGRINRAAVYILSGWIAL